MRKRKVLIVIALFILVALALGLVACKKPATDTKQEFQNAYEPQIDSSQYLVAENGKLGVSDVLDFYRAKGFDVENVIAHPGFMAELFPNADMKELVKSVYAIHPPEVYSGIFAITFKEESEARIFANSFYVEDGITMGKQIGDTYYVCFDAEVDDMNFEQNQACMSYINPSAFDFFVIDNINDVLNGDEYTAQNHGYVEKTIQPNIAKMHGGMIRAMLDQVFDEDIGFVKDQVLSELVLVLEKWTGKQFPTLKTDARKTVKAFGDAVDHVYMYHDSAGTMQIVVEFNEKYDSNLRNILVDEVLKNGKGYIMYLVHTFEVFNETLGGEYAYADELSDAERTEVVAKMKSVIEKEAADLDKYEGLGGNDLYIKEEIFEGDKYLSLKATNLLIKKEVKEVIGNRLRDKKLKKVFTLENGFEIPIGIDQFTGYAAIKWGIEEFPDFGMEMMQAYMYRYNKEAGGEPEKIICFIKSEEGQSSFKNQKLGEFFKSKAEEDTHDSYFDKDLMWVAVGDKDLIDVYKSGKMPKEYKITFDFDDCDDFEFNEEGWGKTTYNEFDRFEVKRPRVIVGENPADDGSWFVKVGEVYEEIPKDDLGRLYIDADFFVAKDFTDVTLYARPLE